MSFKDLLVDIDTSKACAARLDAAIGFARAHEAHLSGLYTMADLSVPGFAEAQIPADVLAAGRQWVIDKAAAAEAMFTQATEKAGMSAEWRCVSGDRISILALHGRYADLTIVGQTDKDDPFSTSMDLAGKLIFEAGGPVLVIPYIGTDRFGEHVMVAWNASREAVRAIHDALPVLVRAKTVDVLSINPPAGARGDGDIPSADICLHLARHGVRAEADHIEAHDIKVGDMLLSRAADKGVDLIVMGAYGHSRLRETVFGGATRHLLEHMTVPVLLSH
ncbi:MAG: universal stress protein [Acidiferrobacterales bacterium]